MPELIQQHRIRFKREVKILTTALLFLCVNIFAVADQPNSTPPLKKNCFNFSATILNPIVPIIEGQKSGKTETKLDYAVASAKVEKTIQALLDQDLDPKTARNNSDTVVKIKTLPLGPERLVVIPPHCIFHCNGEAAVPHFWVHFSYQKSLTAKQHSPLALTPELAELSLIANLRALWDSGRPSRSEKNLLLGLALIHAVMSREDFDWISAQPSSLQKVMRFIDLNFQSELKIRQIAEIAGLSETGLTRLFKKHLGTSPARYLIDARIREATTLLQSTEESIDEIAEKTGFSNRYYFTRMFKKTTGQSPAGFRKDHILKYSATDSRTRS